jgi:AcrR family transcriptional regulator
MIQQNPPAHRPSGLPDPVDPLLGDGPGAAGASPVIPALRRDAARNRDKILAAARAAFDEEGVDVGVEVIAQRAGVGVGTLYRRFPTKEQLIEAVVNELLEQVHTAATTVLQNQPPGDGFAEYLLAVGWLQFEHAGCLARLWATADSEWRRRIQVVTQTLLTRAQEAGTVRPELVYEDVIMLFWSLRGVIEATSSISPEAWLRFLDLLLASLAPGQPLEHPPLTPQQAEAAKAAASALDISRLGG